MTILPTDQTGARGRFIALNAMRVGGVVMVLLGLAVSQHKIDLPQWTAYLLIGLGMIEAFAMPLIFTRLWRSERDRNGQDRNGR